MLLYLKTNSMKFKISDLEILIFYHHSIIFNDYKQEQKLNLGTAKILLFFVL